MSEKSFDERVEERVHAEMTPLDTKELYEEMLNECYPDVSIAGHTYATAHALKLVDETAYRCGKVDFEDTLIDRGHVEIDGMWYDGEEVDEIKSEIEDAIEEEQAQEVEHEG